MSGHYESVSHSIYFIFPLSSGLTLDERIACSAAGQQQQQGQHKTGIAGASGTSATADDAAAIVVPLIVLTVWRTAGVTVAAASRDLRCRLNGEDIAMEAHLIPGQCLSSNVCVVLPWRHTSSLVSVCQSVFIVLPRRHTSFLISVYHPMFVLYRHGGKPHPWSVLYRHGSTPHPWSVFIILCLCCIAMVAHLIPGQCCIVMVAHLIPGQCCIVMVAHLNPGQCCIVMVAHLNPGQCCIVMVAHLNPGQCCIVMVAHLNFIIPFLVMYGKYQIWNLKNLYAHASFLFATGTTAKRSKSRRKIILTNYRRSQLIF